MADREEARPACGAGALFVDEDGHVMIVEPTYRRAWEIPGGPVERGESPREACIRELEDGLGLDLPPGRLLVVDWAPEVMAERVFFVYDGGVLTEDRLDAIELRSGEICGWAFLPPDELFVMTAPDLTRRITAALGARATGETFYLERGTSPTPGS